MDKRLRDVAKRIAMIEEQIETANLEERKKLLSRIEGITSHLSFTEMLAVDDYIMEKRLLNKDSSKKY